MRSLWFAALSIAVPPIVTAQGNSAPAGWRWAVDGPARIVNAEDAAQGSADAMWFVEMAPGFHVTMGPGGNLYHPSSTVEGRYEVESEFFLFPGSSNEGYGFFVGGKGLDREAEWVGFVVRGDGSAGVIRRRNGAIADAREWRPSSAIVASRTDGTARNVLKLVVGANIVFQVNGADVARISRDSLTVDGVVGLRAGKGVNLHVTSFDLTRRMAPVPVPKPKTP